MIIFASLVTRTACPCVVSISIKLFYNNILSRTVIIIIIIRRSITILSRTIYLRILILNLCWFLRGWWIISCKLLRYFLNYFFMGDIFILLLLCLFILFINLLLFLFWFLFYFFIKICLVLLSIRNFINVYIFILLRIIKILLIYIKILFFTYLLYGRFNILKIL